MWPVLQVVEENYISTKKSLFLLEPQTIYYSLSAVEAPTVRILLVQNSLLCGSFGCLILAFTGNMPFLQESTQEKNFKHECGCTHQNSNLEKSCVFSKPNITHLATMVTSFGATPSPSPTSTSTASAASSSAASTASSISGVDFHFVLF